MTEEDNSNFWQHLKTVTLFDKSTWMFNNDVFTKSFVDVSCNWMYRTRADGSCLTYFLFADKTKVIDVPKKNIGLFSPSSLLIESLIEYICSLIEKDTANQKKLYLSKISSSIFRSSNVHFTDIVFLIQTTICVLVAICRKLHELQLIDESYLINDFDFIRNHYQKELYRLVTVAKSVSPIVPRYNIPVPTVPIKK